jgi:hypothetical protein
MYQVTHDWIYNTNKPSYVYQILQIL